MAMRVSMKLALMGQFGRARVKQLIVTGTEELESASGSVENSNRRSKNESGAVTAING